MFLPVIGAHLRVRPYTESRMRVWRRFVGATRRVAPTVIIALLLTLLIALPTFAQDAISTPAPTSVITDDDVNRVSSQLYCPVCPNELLSDCRTQACVQWRGEIRTQLEAGQTDAQIIDSFVARYGDRVIPIPRDPVLQVMALLTPFLLAAVLLAVGVITFMRWRRPRVEVVPEAPPPPPPDDDYRDRIERDLKG